MPVRKENIVTRLIELRDIAFDVLVYPEIGHAHIVIMERKKKIATDCIIYSTQIRIDISSEDFKKLVNMLNEIVEEQIKLEQKLIEEGKLEK